MLRTLASLLIAASLLAGCTLLKGIDADLEPLIESGYAPAEAAALFYAAHDRWPADAVELDAFARAQRLDFDMNRYGSIELREQPDGSLRIDLDIVLKDRTGPAHVVVQQPEKISPG